MSDDEDPLAAHLDQISKRVEKIVNTRLQYYIEQFATLVGEFDALAKRVQNCETVINLQLQNSVFNSRSVGILKDELDALQAYLATKDVDLKKLLLEVRERNLQESVKRSLRNERG
jgi:hypothetical protein